MKGQRTVLLEYGDFRRQMPVGVVFPNKSKLLYLRICSKVLGEMLMGENTMLDVKEPKDAWSSESVH